MIKRLIIAGFAAIVVVAVVGWFLTAPQLPDLAPLNGLSGDPDRGARIFHLSGCASCHAAEGAEGEAMLALGGGKKFETPFGRFLAPNVSPDKATGIGDWTLAQFAVALKAGVSPQGAHYYPAFPYAAYVRMQWQDIVDLKAYMDTLPAVSRANEPHELAFPFNIRRGLAVWKWLHMDPEPVVALAAPSEELSRGQYLVEGPGHCGECHTERNFMGGLIRDRWLAGAPNPSGKGRIPNITDHDTGLADWSAPDIVEYLTTGFTPEYDTAGSTMAEVVENTSKLPQEDREAIAAYLKAIPALPK